MGLLYEKAIRPILFKADAEDAHERAIKSLKFLCHFKFLLKLMERYNCVVSERPIELFGLNFPNPVGLAAGFDKNAECWPAMSALGFGFVEIGTVTAKEQPGNQRPRLFRLLQHEALINRMGFNNEGVEKVAQRLAAQFNNYKRSRIPLGINIGKSKVTTLDHAAQDYLTSFKALADYADYFAINVSSPNTPGLRKLQGKDHLEALLTALNEANHQRAVKLGKQRLPMLLKIAPDMSFQQVDTIVETLMSVGLDGVIATNTMVERPGAMGEITESGGLSGQPIASRAINIVNYIHRSTNGKLPVIGVGGIVNERAAGAFFDAGASLVQLYSGMVYRGPFWAREVARAVSWRQREWV